MHVGGVIVNRVHYEAEVERPDPELREHLAELLGDAELADRVAENFDDFRLLSERDRRNVDRLISELGSPAVIEVPYLDHDVHDLAGLIEVNRYLFASGSDERAAIATAV